MLSDIVTIAVIYITTLLSFTLIKDKRMRVITSILILTASIYLFKLNFKMAAFVIFLGFGGAVTEIFL